MGLDRYKRSLGVVYLGEAVVNLWLVQEGHAWVYRGGHNDAPPALLRQLEQVEATARAARRGLWQAPNPEPPWEYKRRRSRGQTRPTAEERNIPAPGR